MATRDIVAPLYNGNQVVTYRNGNHRYYVDNRAIPSVTTIIGAVLAKPELMLWPMNLALKYLEERLPNITAEDLTLARSAHVRRRESGAHTGTTVHYLIEQRLTTPKGYSLSIDFNTLPQDVQIAAMAFETWFRQNCSRFTVRSVESIVYSPTLGYAGTYDAILKMDGHVILCDMKTTNAGLTAPQGIYPEHFIQMGAYYTAYEEERQSLQGTRKYRSMPPIEDLMVISVKKTGEVHTQRASNIGFSLDQAERAWRDVMGVYKQINALKTSLKGGV